MAEQCITVSKQLRNLIEEEIVYPLKEREDIDSIHDVEIVITVERRNPYFEICWWDERLRKKRISCNRCAYKEECNKGEYILDTITLHIPM